MGEQNENKPWYLSKAVWGGIVALLAGIASVFGYSVAPEDQRLIVDAALAVASAVGGAAAIYGRVKAAKKIK